MRAAALLAAGLLVAGACTRLRDKGGVTDGREAVYSFLSHGSVSVAEGMLEDRWDLGPRFDVVTIPSITWREDPFQSNYWRFLFYSLRPTSNLLWAYYSTGQVRYRDKLVEILRSFTTYDAARPAAYDRLTFDYRHAAGFRALVLVNTYGKLRRSADLPADLAVGIEASLRKLGGFLARTENFDSSYNHGFAEAAGLLAIAVNLPQLPESDVWRDLAGRRLATLMTEAVDADGVELENSPFYHFYVLGFALDIDRWDRAYASGLPASFGAATRRMAHYATQIVHPDGTLPRIGATVQTSMANLSTGPFGALAAEDPEFAWVYASGRAGRPPAERAVLFGASGQAILRSGFGTTPESYAEQAHLAFNVGAWRTNHSHLDVLGVDYHADGALRLADSGVYSYSPGTAADYFSGTRAHNTVVVDGADQSPDGLVAAGITTSGADWAYQSGWHALYPGVTHRRAVLLLGRHLLLVADALEAEGAHRFTQTWHLAPGASYSAAGADVQVSEPGHSGMAIRQGLAAPVPVGISGDEDPMQGWVSLTYGHREPAWALEYTAEGARAHFVTLIASGDEAAASARVTAAWEEGDRITATVCSGTERYVVTLASIALAGEGVVVEQAGAGECP